jgi:hypothetical protein
VNARQDQCAIRHEVRETAGDEAPASGASAVHDPATQHSPAAQDLPHAPQLLGSARWSVHTPAQTRPRQPPHDPLTHDSLGVQCLPHAPQLDGSQFMSGQ